MKKIMALLITCFSAFATVWGQDPCTTVRVQSPVVSKPAEATSNITGNCNEVRISWKGNPQQTYIVSGTYTDRNTGLNTQVEAGNSITCNDTECTAILAVKPGNTLTWSIQAVEMLQGRTFYSYPFRGEQQGCEDALTDNRPLTASRSANNDALKKGLPVKTELMVYPNPATGELIIRWSDAYQGAANLSILDAGGKIMKQSAIQKQQLNYLDRISVSGLLPGIYFMQIKMQNGQSLTTRFMKK
jgi:hypothetical protein